MLTKMDDVKTHMERLRPIILKLDPLDQATLVPTLVAFCHLVAETQFFIDWANQASIRKLKL